MFSLKFVLWVIAYTSGVACLSLAIQVWIKKRRAEDAWKFVFLLAFVIVIVSLVHFETVDKDGRFTVSQYVATYASMVILVSLPSYVHYRLGMTRRRQILGLTFLLTGILGTLGLTASLWTSYRVKLVCLVLVLLMSISILYSDIQLIWYGRRRRGFTAHFQWSVVTIVLVPLMAWIDFFQNALNRFFVLPVLYTFTNLIFILVGRGDLLRDLEPREDLAASFADSAGLTPRELEVAVLLADGRSYKQIAEDLFISLPTVKTHANRIYAKSGCTNKTELRKQIYPG